jgi:hypothetical protein
VSEGATNGLVDLLDRLLDTGVAVGGDVTLALADVDLVHVQLRALLASVEAELRGVEGSNGERPEWLPPPRRRRVSAESLPGRFDADSDSLEAGLAKLVLVVAELLRDLMERQAIRRMRSGSLDRDEIERLSLAFTRLDERLDRMYAQLGVGADPRPPQPILAVARR